MDSKQRWPVGGLGMTAGRLGSAGGRLGLLMAAVALVAACANPRPAPVVNRTQMPPLPAPVAVQPAPAPAAVPPTAPGPAGQPGQVGQPGGEQAGPHGRGGGGSADERLATVESRVAGHDATPQGSGRQTRQATAAPIHPHDADR